MIGRALVLVMVFAALLAGDTVAAPADPGAKFVSAACRIAPTENNRAVALFQRMLPVLQNARCANCHGAMDVSSATTDHGGGQIDLVESAKPDRDGRRFADCQDCHTRATEEIEKAIAAYQQGGRRTLSPAEIRDRYNAGHWRPVTFNVAKWGARTPQQICRSLKAGPFAGARMLSHLRDDVLIGLAFEGKRGQDLDPEPPPMSRASFVSLVQDWMTAMDARDHWQQSPDCGCVEVSLPSDNFGPEGNWDTTEGTMMLTEFGDLVRGTYSQDNGRIDAVIEGRVVNGTWAEDGSDRRCEESQLGSRYWGRIRWEFIKDTFTGTWGYCDDEPTRPWRGTRK